MAALHLIYLISYSYSRLYRLINILILLRCAVRLNLLKFECRTEQECASGGFVLRCVEVLSLNISSVWEAQAFPLGWSSAHLLMAQRTDAVKEKAEEDEEKIKVHYGNKQRGGLGGGDPLTSALCVDYRQMEDWGKSPLRWYQSFHCFSPAMAAVHALSCLTCRSTERYC